MTREDIAPGFIDDGRFSERIHPRPGAEHQLHAGERVLATTYPPPGTVQTYKYVPIWRTTLAMAGLTRGISEFDRRFWAGGSRRFLRVQNWWYFPNLFWHTMAHAVWID